MRSTLSPIHGPNHSAHVSNSTCARRVDGRGGCRVLRYGRFGKTLPPERSKCSYGICLSEGDEFAPSCRLNCRGVYGVSVLSPRGASSGGVVALRVTPTLAVTIAALAE